MRRFIRKVLEQLFRLPRLGEPLRAAYMRLCLDRGEYAAWRETEGAKDAGAGPYKFIPRDAGLFSVVNYLAGELVAGRRAYPLFCRREFLRYRNANKGFAYFGPEGANSWFAFFEPLRYDPSDRLHEDAEALRRLPFTDGSRMSADFSFPENARKARSEADFAQWRREVHRKVAHLIRPVPALREQVDRTLALMPGSRIGVHVRHPSHIVEQGTVLFRDYFAVLDQLAQERPDCRIYLATDNEMALAVFRHRYGDRLLWSEEAGRLPADSVLEWAFALVEGKPDSMGFVSGRSFQHHCRVAEQADFADGAGLRAGREAVVDLFTLAACDDLVCTYSNFTLACSYLNPGQRQHLVASGNGRG